MASDGGDARPGLDNVGSAPGAACLVAADVATAGRRLAAATHRRVHAITHANLAEVSARLIDAATTSLAIVVPGWSPDGAVSAAWLRVVIEVARVAGFRDVPWGIITGSSPAELDALVTRTIAEHHEPTCRGSVTVASFADDDLLALLPGLDATEAPLIAVGGQQLRGGRNGNLLNRAHGALIFRGHGRAYCALDGYLCGARSLAEAADAPRATCLSDMSCQGADFARIDPRRYRAPVMVMDCCGAANATAEGWKEGVPSLAFFALAGAATAVIASDGVTMGGEDELLDILAALAMSGTLGLATATINRQRAHAAVGAAYLLLGDPDLPSGPARFPGLTRMAEVEPAANGLSVRTGAGGHLWRVPLPVRGGGIPTLVSAPPSTAAGGFRLVADETGEHLWLLTDGTPRSFAVAFDCARQVSADLLAFALDLPRRSARLLPAVKPSVRPLDEAAERVIQIANVVDSASRRVAPRLPGGAAALVGVAEQRWTAAHAAVLSNLVPAHFAGGVWPFRLWRAGRFSAWPSDRACPYCGEATVIERAYESAPLGRRRQRECMGCDLIEDADEQDGSFAALAAPRRVRLHAPIEVMLRIGAGASVRRGAAAIALDGKAHGYAVDRPVQPFRIDAGRTIDLGATFRAVGQSGVAHHYRLKALVLLDGFWRIVSRPIVIDLRAGDSV